ncbi:hypothetical protein EJB05_04286 [Eragrostis curvula]|uniref:NPH3 domain-containing protein n=1 Tax=Eragrostis curvula TaxID=38414 RepID=A0A5J9WA05_9POAL|nr:hypothetical protein EJB05_04286 [Eragrostis curvula]
MQGRKKNAREMAREQPQQPASSKGQAWFCTTGLPSDVVIEVGDMTFHLHKFPLMSKSKKLHDLITNRESREASRRERGEQDEDEGEIREEEIVLEEDEEADALRIRLPEFPGGAEAFELAAKFCYGVKLDLTPSTAAPLRCAAERLGMVDDHAEDNLVSRADRFISQTVLRNPRDAIRALKSCEGQLFPLADELGLVSRCVDAVAAKAAASTPTALFGWPIPDEARTAGGGDRNHRRKNNAGGAGASWFDDLAGLSLATFTRVIAAMKERGVGPDVVEGALIAYAKRSIPGLSRSGRHVGGGGGGGAVAAPASSDSEQKALLETVIANLPEETITSTAHTGTALGATTARVLFGLLRTSSILHASESSRDALERRVAARLPDAAVDDLLLPSYSYLVETLYDVDCVERVVRYFLEGRDRRVQQRRRGAHPGLTEEEKEKVSGVVDGRKLTLEACTHAAQNERLPLRTVVQVLFFEQLQLRRAIARTIMANEDGGGAAGSGEEGGGGLSDGGGTTWRVAARGNQMLRLDMDSMRSRVQELERECTSMRKAIEKMDRRGGGAAAGDRGGAPSSAAEGRWGSMVTKRFGCKFPAQVCQSQQRTVVARTRRPRIEQSP